MFGKFRLVDFSLERLRFLLDRVGLGYLIVTPRMEAKTSLYCATEPSLDEPQFSGQVNFFGMFVKHQVLQGGISVTVRRSSLVLSRQTSNWPLNSGTGTLSSQAVSVYSLEKMKTRTSLLKIMTGIISFLKNSSRLTMKRAIIFILEKYMKLKRTSLLKMMTGIISIRKKYMRLQKTSLLRMVTDIISILEILRRLTRTSLLRMMTDIIFILEIFRRLKRTSHLRMMTGIISILEIFRRLKRTSLLRMMTGIISIQESDSRLTRTSHLTMMTGITSILEYSRRLMKTGLLMTKEMIGFL